MKKKVLLGFALLLTALSASADNSQKLRIKGELKGFKDSVTVVMGREDKISMPIPNGKFDFYIEVTEPKNILLTVSKTSEGNKRVNYPICQFVAVPNETAVITGDSTSYDITGSKFYQEYHEMDLMRKEARKPLDELVNSLNASMKAGGKRDSLIKIYREKSPAAKQHAEDAYFAFIKANPGNEAGATLIDEFGSLEKMEEAKALLSDQVKNGRMKQIIDDPINYLKEEQEREAEAAKKQASGVLAPDFTLNDNHGKPLKLSNLRGKYVLLDFWGSWCIWCIRGIPQMKAYYEKYKGKYEILSIDCRDTQEKWKAALEKYQMPWLHVYNPQNSTILKDYGIQGFPTKILLGPDGKIVKTIVGEDPAFYTFLDETFGKK